MKTKKSTLAIGFLSIIVLIFLDQITKYLAIVNLKEQAPIVLLKNVFELQYLENQGAAFGLMQGKKTLFVIMTVLILAFICYCYGRIPDTARYRLIRIVMILFAGGAIGNFIDRITKNYVVDFFYFSLINFPIFNVADIYVTVAAFLMICSILFYYKESEYDDMVACLRPGKKK